MTKENIFETAAKKLGHAKKEPEKTKQKHPPPPPRAYIDTEMQEMLSKIRFMKDDLKNKIDEIMSKTGPKAEYFKKILQRDYNISPQEWDKIQLAKKLLGDKVWESIGIKPDAKSEPVQTPSNRKGKTLGSRKKWIPMR